MEVGWSGGGTRQVMRNHHNYYTLYCTCMCVITSVDTNRGALGLAMRE